MHKNIRQPTGGYSNYLARRKRRTIKMIVFAVIFIPVVVLLSKIGYNTYIDNAYPQKYSTFVEQYAAKNQLNEEFVYAVIKCESGFDPEAVSSIGARGLMQMTEDTFDWVKSRMNDPREENTTFSDLYDPETSIRYGTFLLNILMSDFNNNETSVLCAYHAGRGITMEWLNDPEYSTDGENITYIPYGNTSVYVDRVLKAQKMYQDLYYS